MRKIIGWPLILFGYVWAIMALDFNGALYPGKEFDFFSLLFLLAIADAAILLGCLIAGARMGVKPSFTSPIIAIITWLLIILLLPYVHMLKTIFALLKMLFTGKRPVAKAGRSNTGKTGGEKEVYKRAANICRSYGRRENIGSGVTAECKFNPNVFSHLIEIDVDVHFDVDERQVTNEYEANVAKSAIEEYCRSVPISSIQSDILKEIEKLAENYEDVAGEWKVALGNVRTI